MTFISNRAIKKKKDIFFVRTFNQSLKKSKRNRINKIKAKSKNAFNVYFLKIDKIYVNDEAMIEYLSLNESLDLFTLTKVN